ncbi:MAG TPA: helix-turn-helix transcriptional regulator [Solirubrobacteraceae bacterium]|nr:helix-turn-helix transcriptional regulator [Solirubrobacteraceae bacterium]
MQRSIAQAGKPSLAHQVELALVLYRDARRMSQQQLAERLGVKQPQVARLESGLVNPSMDTLLRISERLGIEFTLEIDAEGLTVRYVLPD